MLVDGEQALSRVHFLGEDVILYCLLDQVFVLETLTDSQLWPKPDSHVFRGEQHAQIQIFEREQARYDWWRNGQFVVARNNERP